MNPRFSTIKLYSLLVILLLTASLQTFSQSSQPFSINESPLGAPTSPVMDYSGVLDAATKQSLEKRIIEFRDQTNPKVELAVAIVDTTGDRPIFDYSLAVARGWGIGSKEDDNPSALLFIAIKDRKYFTQISRDLEDELPDGLAGQLQRQYLVPAFKQGDYSKGVSDTIDAYIRTIKTRNSGGQQPDSGITTNGNGSNVRRSGSKSSGISSVGCCLIILFVLLIIIFSRFGSGGGRGGRGGGSGWGGGGFGGALPWVIGSILANSGGRSSGSSSGGWGGGFSGGSSGGWGGFGGGGDFGGGGAGGSW